MNDRLTKAETTVAVLLTIVAIGLRVGAAFAAGALWRDEANSVAVATLPSISDVWRNLQYDSFPILWLMIVRLFSTIVGPMNDGAFRAVGFAVGAAIVATLWWYARTFRYRLPLLSLVVVGLSPSFVVWADSARAYGTGILCMLITGILLWRFIEQPTGLRFGLAAIGALASVQTLYYNSVLLLAFSLGAVAICVKRKDSKSAAGIIAIGLVAAISVSPYLSTFRDAAKWNTLVRIPSYTIRTFWNLLAETLAPGGSWQLVFWTGLTLFTVVAGVLGIRRATEAAESGKKKEIVIFSTTTLIAAVVGIFLFLRTLSYGTRPWYYLSMLAVCAVCVDAIAGLLAQSSRARLVRLVVTSVVVVAMLVPSAKFVSARLTNVDRIAAQVGRDAGSRDFVVVYPWFMGVTFNRYYRGAAGWETVPPIGFHAFHRYDLLKEKLMEANQHEPVRPLETEMTAALSRGHRVFIVGALPDSRYRNADRLLSPAQLDAKPWLEGNFEGEWAVMVDRFLRAHSTTIQQFRSDEPAWMISNVEYTQLMVATGWRQ